MKIKILFFTNIILILLLTAIWNYNYKKQNSYSYTGNNLSKFIVSEILECNARGTNCKTKYKYEYNENGNKIEYYNPNTNWLEDFELGKHYKEIRIYDSADKKLTDNLVCDDEHKNCKRLNKYEYDKNGNLIKEYLNCKNDLTDCGYINYYTYDINNNKIYENFTCGKSYSINCGKFNKYEYDYNGNNITSYKQCNDKMECEYTNINIFKNNLLTSSYVCSDNLKNCTKRNDTKYDEFGNKTANYNNCDINGNNCSASYFYNYKYDDNKNIIETIETYESYRNGTKDFSTQSLYKYEYNDKNQLISKQECDVNENNCSILEKSLTDSYGNLLEKFIISGSKPTIYKYKYICE